MKITQTQYLALVAIQVHLARIKDTRMLLMNLPGISAVTTSALHDKGLIEITVGSPNRRKMATITLLGRAVLALRQNTPLGQPTKHDVAGLCGFAHEPQVSAEIQGTELVVTLRLPLEDK